MLRRPGNLKNMDEARHPEHRPPPQQWPSRRQSAFLRYGVVVVCIFVAFAIRYSLTPLIVDYDPFMFFAPAALIAAWFGGIGPGIAAWILGILVGVFFFTGPAYQFWPYA